MYRAYKFRMYLTDKQKELLNKSFNFVQKIINYCMTK